MAGFIAYLFKWALIRKVDVFFKGIIYYVYVVIIIIVVFYAKFLISLIYSNFCSNLRTDVFFSHKN